MTIPIYTNEYADIQAQAEASFRDLCKLGSATIAAGFDPDNKTWTYGAVIACGFDASKSREVTDGSEATITDAVMRVSLSVDVTGYDRVQVTKREGVTVSEYYAIVGAPRRGISCYVLNLKRLVGNSAT